jgi:hypothetical protein
MQQSPDPGFGLMFWILIGALSVALMVEFRGLLGGLWQMCVEAWNATDRPIWRRAPRNQTPASDKPGPWCGRQGGSNEPSSHDQDR